MTNYDVRQIAVSLPAVATCHPSCQSSIGNEPIPVIAVQRAARISELQSNLPLNLTPEAAQRFPHALAVARSLEEDAVSLDSIRRHLVDRNRLSAEEAVGCIDQYLKYLTLVAVTGLRLAPSAEADEAWHSHILHTQQYEAWCQRHFGRFIHHEPSAPGIHPPEGFLEMQSQLGALFFGEHSIYRDKSGHCHNSHPFCSHCTQH